VKQKIGNQNALHPKPVTIAAALVNGKVNFINEPFDLLYFSAW